jgi:large subunit ribosomal protein L7/L12
VAVLRCDACGGETFEPLTEAGYYRCHNCGAPGIVKLASTGVRLKSAGRNKLGVIKALRECTGWDLRQAKGFVDAADNGVPQAMPGDPGAAERIAQLLIAQGAVVERG